MIDLKIRPFLSFTICSTRYNYTISHSQLFSRSKVINRISLFKFNLYAELVFPYYRFAYLSFGALKRNVQGSREYIILQEPVSLDYYQ